MKARTAAVVCSVVVFAVLLVPGPPAIGATPLASPPTIVVINPGQSLASGTTLVAGNYELVMQADGNLVLSTLGNSPAVVWDTGTNGFPGASAVMQADGNFVVYAPAGGAALWDTGTAGDDGASFVFVEDGNLAVTGAGMTLWSSGTTGDIGPITLGPGQELQANQTFTTGSVQLGMQSDGNLVLSYLSPVPQVLWDSGTGGHPGAYAVVQADGNLVVYGSSGGPALWDTGTAGLPGALVVVQPDANLVVYAPGGAPVWDSGTAGAVGFQLWIAQRLGAGQYLVSQGGAFTGRMQADGNFVLYQGATPYWQTETAGNPGATIQMQADGNLVLSTASGAALWSSETSGRIDSSAWLLADGNLTVVGSGPGAPVYYWSSGPCVEPGLVC